MPWFVIVHFLPLLFVTRIVLVNCHNPSRVRIIVFCRLILRSFNLADAADVPIDSIFSGTTITGEF